MTDIVFDWEKMLDFSGDSGPYLQYTYARLRSILRKADAAGRFAKLKAKFESTRDFAPLVSDVELALVRKIFEFPDAVEHAAKLCATSAIALYLHKLAVAANKFYETTPILKDEDMARRAARLALAEVAARTLKQGLALLGITALEKI